jgi:hypothetical protein
METDSGSAIAFLDILVIREELTLATKSTGNPPTLADVNFKSNHPLHVKRGLIQSLRNRASTIC